MNYLRMQLFHLLSCTRSLGRTHKSLIRINDLTRMGVGFLIATSLFTMTVKAADLVSLESLASSGKHSLVLRQVDEVIGDNPANPRPLFIKAQSLVKLNRNADAILAYKELTRRFPGLPEPFNNLATLYMADGQLDEARIALEKALSTNTAYNTAFKNLSAVYREMASRAYRQAMNNTVQLEPVQLSGVSQLDSWRPEPVLLVSTNDDLITNQNVVTTVTNPAQKTTAAGSKSGRVDQSPANSILSDISNINKSNSAKSNENGVEIVTVTDSVEINQVQPVIEPDSIQISSRSDNAANTTEQDEIIVEVVKSNSEDVQQNLINTVQRWAKDWSSKDVDSYLSHYAQEFKPENTELSRNAWVKQRTGRLKWRKFIKVAVLQTNVKVDGEHAEVTFNQSYESDVFKDKVTKTLSMKRINDSWKIIRERSEA